MFVKYVFFSLHTLFIVICLVDPYRYAAVTFIQAITIQSWFINNNNCFLTQLEDYFFHDTLINMYFRFRKYTGPRYYPYRVPAYQRYTLYILFTIRCCELLIVLCGKFGKK